MHALNAPAYALVDMFQDIKESVGDDIFGAIMDNAEYITESNITNDYVDAVLFGTSLLAESAVIDSSVYDVVDNVINESVFGPLHKKLDLLKEIRNAKPSQYDDAETVKKFVDKYYNDIMKCAQTLEKESEPYFGSKAVKGITIAMVTGIISGFVIMLPGMIAECTAAMTIGIVAYLVSILCSLVMGVIWGVRGSEDDQAQKELDKIRSALKKIDLKKLPEQSRRKIINVINAIDDVDTSMSARVKVAHENTSDKLYYIAAEAKLDALCESYMDVMNEINKGQIQGDIHEIESRLTGHIKNAKAAMKQANNLVAAGDKKAAKRQLDYALNELKAGRKEAEKIEDDGLLAGLVETIVVGLIPALGELIWLVHKFVTWYFLHTKSTKGEVEFSKKHPKLKPNLVREFFFGVILPKGTIARGFTRARVLGAYDKLIDTVKIARNSVDDGAISETSSGSLHDPAGVMASIWCI